jgi:CheY-like chemotaxis protein
MPMLDGDGLLARVRSSRLTRLRQMPVLMIAGDNEAANERARVLGASDFIGREIGSHRTARTYRLAAAVGTVRRTSCGEPGTRRSTSGNRATDSPHIEVQAAQALSQALRHDAPASILVMGFDRFDALREGARRRGCQAVAENVRQHSGAKGAQGRQPRPLFRQRTGGGFARYPYPACEAFAIACGKRLRSPILRYTGNASISRSVLASPIRRSIGQPRQRHCSVWPVSVSRPPQTGRRQPRRGLCRQTVDRDPGAQAWPCHRPDQDRPCQCGDPASRPSWQRDTTLSGTAGKGVEVGSALADIRKRMLDREQEVQDTRQA